MFYVPRLPSAVFYYFPALSDPEIPKVSVV